MKKIFTLLSTLISLSSFASGDWYHISLRSLEGVNIQVDYQLSCSMSQSYKPTGGCYLNQMYVNLSDNIDNNSSVSVVVINREIYNSWGSYSGQNSVVQIRNVPWYDTHFSANIHEGFMNTYSNKYPYSSMNLYATGYGPTIKYQQEIAIVVDGQWLVEPLSGGHNFIFNLFEDYKRQNNLTNDYEVFH